MAEENIVKKTCKELGITLEHYASVINVKNIDLGADFSLFGSGDGYKSVTVEKKKMS